MYLFVVRALRPRSLTISVEIEGAEEMRCMWVNEELLWRAVLLWRWHGQRPLLELYREPKDK